MRLLVVEPQPYHGQVLIPLLDVLVHAGATVDLSLRPDHFDRETVLRHASPSVTVHPLQFDDHRGLARWALSVNLRKTDAVLITTVRPSHWYLPLLLGLRHRRTSAIFHNVDRFPSPATPDLAVRGRLICRLTAALMRRLLVLSGEVAAFLGAHSPGWVQRRVSVYRPLPGRESTVVPPDDLAVFAVPGAINPARRDYPELLTLLRTRTLDSRIRFRLIGSERQSDPELLETLSAFSPWIELAVQDWWDYDELLHEVASSHYILPLMRGKRYQETSVPAAIGWADGLAKPLLLSSVQGLEDAAEGVFDGRWSELCARSRERRDRLWREDLECMRDLGGNLFRSDQSN